MQISLRQATMKDAVFLLMLKNDRVMRQFAVVTNKKIKKKDHIRWLKDHVDEMKIVMVGTKKAGMMRISKDREVSINLHPKFRGKGLGGQILVNYCPSGVWAKIVNGNLASMKLFLNNDFKIVDYKENYYVLKN